MGARRVGLVRLNGVQKEKLHDALLNTNSAVTYSDIAHFASVAKPTAVKHAKVTGLRPKGNYLATRLVKQPKIHARLLRRARLMENYIRVETQCKRGVSVNYLQHRFGGEKKFAAMVLVRVGEALRKEGVSLIRRTKGDQPKRSTPVPSLSQAMRHRV